MPKSHASGKGPSQGQKFQPLAMPPDVPHDAPCCGIAAIAMAAAISYQQAHAAGEIVNDKDGRWKGATSDNDVPRILDFLEVGFESVFDFRKYRTRDRPRLLDIMQDEIFGLAPENIHIAWTTGHVQVVTNGLIFDQAHQLGIGPGTRLGRKRTRKVIKIHQQEA